MSIPTEVWLALIIGLLQGVFEWLPVSSEGIITATGMLGQLEPVVAIQLALFVHLGTAMAAAGYHRSTLRGWMRDLPTMDDAALRFWIVATAVTGVVGIVIYRSIVALLAGVGAAVAVAMIGGLLVLTGAIQLVDAGSDETRTKVTLGDALLIGILQGTAIIPGISRSAVTTSGLLLLGVDGPAAFRLSFLLAIPASVGAAGLAVLDAGGIPAVAFGPAVVTVGTAALVGAGTIGVLMRIAERVDFSVLAIGFGMLTIGGAGVMLLS